MSRHYERQKERQKTPQPGQEQPDIVAGAYEDGVDRVASGLRPDGFAQEDFSPHKALKARLKVGYFGKSRCEARWSLSDANASRAKYLA